jgi:mannosyltransferase
VVDVAAKQKKYTLVLVGGGALSKHEWRLLDQKLKNRFLHISTVDSPTLNVLLNFAFCLVYPSEYEGFGIPILEAMKAGCPVITTNVSSLPEVCGDAALKVDQICVDKIEEKIYCLEDGSARQTLIEKGFKQASQFTWDRVYRETERFYNKL